MVQLNLERSSFTKALAQCLSVIPARPSHPVLNGVLVQVESNGNFTLKATSLQIWVTCRLTGAEFKFGKGETPTPVVEFIIGEPANLLKVLQKSDDIEIRIGVKPYQETGEDEEPVDNRLILTTGVGKYKMHTLNPDDFPTPELLEEGKTFSIEGGDLMKAIARVGSFASTEETKQILTGVCLVSSEFAVEFAATDGHRLAVAGAPIDDFGIPGGIQAVCPVTPLRLANQAIIRKEDPVNFVIGESGIKIDVGSVVIHSRRIEGSYPQYRQLIPVSHYMKHHLCIDRQDFLAALDRVGIFAETGTIILEPVEGGYGDARMLRIRASDADVSEVMELSPSDTPMIEKGFAFNPKYLMKAVQAIDTPEFSLELNTPTQPVMLRPVGAEHEMLVMPVQQRD